MKQQVVQQRSGKCLDRKEDIGAQSERIIKMMSDREGERACHAGVEHTQWHRKTEELWMSREEGSRGET